MSDGIPPDLLKHYLDNPASNMDVMMFRPYIVTNKDGSQTWELQMLDFGGELVRTHVFNTYASCFLTACFFSKNCGIEQSYEWWLG